MYSIPHSNLRSLNISVCKTIVPRLRGLSHAHMTRPLESHFEPQRCKRPQSTHKSAQHWPKPINSFHCRATGSQKRSFSLCSQQTEKASLTNPTSNMSNNPQSTTISLASPEHLDAISDLINLAYTPYIARLNGKKPAPMTADYASLISSSCVYILSPASAPSTSSTVLGCISLELGAKSDALEINNLAVSPTAQGKGYGKLLMKFAEDVAKEKGVKKLELYTNVKMVENLILYKKLGYEEIGRWSEDGFERVFFVKEL